MTTNFGDIPNKTQLGILSNSEIMAAEQHTEKCLKR